MTVRKSKLMSKNHKLMIGQLRYQIRMARLVTRMMIQMMMKMKQAALIALINFKIFSMKSMINALSI